MSKVYDALRRAERERRIFAAGKDQSPPALEENQAAPREHSALRTFAAVPVTPLPKRGYRPLLMSGERMPAHAAGQFQILSARVAEWGEREARRVLLITSAVAGEGKSFVAVNLAAVLARPQRPVLLIDANLRAPVLHRAFNLVPLRGLINMLNGEAGYEDSVLESSLTGVKVIPAGGITPAAAEVLGSPLMRELLAGVRALDPRQFIIIDCSAALTFPESHLLAGLADAVIPVIAANKTPRETVLRAVEAMRPRMAFGAVMNRFEPPHSAFKELPGEPE